MKLITGPANSGRAGEIMRDYRARLAEEPMLVVPGFSDVDHSVRELAGAGAVIGADVVRFAWLFETIAERCGGSGGRRATRLQRELLAEETVAATRLRRLRSSARGPGFARALVRFAAELERAMVEPDAFERAVGAWRGAGAHVREAAALYAGYRTRLEEAGLIDDELFAWRALDALRARPDRFGRTPVFVYGFDDFTEIELGALEALSERAGVAVTVSLPYERGRAAFKGVAGVFERLRAAADEHVELPALADHYAPESREALFALERGLYEPGGPPASPGDAVTVLSAGGERAEVELVASNALRLLRSGIPAGEIAVVFRDPARYATLVQQVFGAYGVPFSLERRVPLAHTALGRGVLALLRCTRPSGEPADLVAYLRTPGLLEYPRLADRLEADIRKEGAQTLAAARSLWERRRAWRLDEIDRLRRARAGEPLLAELDRQLDELFARAHRREAPLFADDELDDARVVAAVHDAVRELLALSGRVALDARRVHDKLARVQVVLGERPRPDRVQLASPESIRARRFQAVFVCGLQAGEFPRAMPSEPFLSPDDRRALAAASGLVIPQREDELDRERHLFYVCASRPERKLFLSSRYSDEQGNPEVGSFLVEDVLDVFDGTLAADVETRLLSDVTWDPDGAPTETEWRRAVARLSGGQAPRHPDGIREPARVPELQGEWGYSAGGLETFADCPVKWLVERVLRPDELEPDAEPLVRGSYAHAVLEETYRRLDQETGSARVRPETLAAAERVLLETLADKRESYRISPRETRFRTAVRKLEFDLLRHLRRESEAETSFEPARLELSFGMDDGEPPLEIGDGGIRLRGRVDRVDVDGGRAVVLDYKSGKRAYPVARWATDNRLQVPLYMLAVRALLGLDPVAGLYVPLAGPKARPRGIVRSDEADAVGSACTDRDVREPDEFERELARAAERACELAARMRAGDIRPCPDSCAWNGGCSYPSICREEPR